MVDSLESHDQSMMKTGRALDTVDEKLTSLEQFVQSTLTTTKHLQHRLEAQFQEREFSEVQIITELQAFRSRGLKMDKLTKDLLPDDISYLQKLRQQTSSQRRSEERMVNEIGELFRCLSSLSAEVCEMKEVQGH